MCTLQNLESVKDGLVVLVDPGGCGIKEKLLGKAIFIHCQMDCFRRRSPVGIEYGPPGDYDDLVRWWPVVLDDILFCPIGLNANIGGAITESTIIFLTQADLSLGKKLRIMEMLQVPGLVNGR